MRSNTLSAKAEVLLALPHDAALGKHVVVAAHAQADAAVAAVGYLRIRQRVEVEVYDVVQRAHDCAYQLVQIHVVLHGDVAEHEAGEVADHELAGARGGHYHGVAALGHHLCGHALSMGAMFCAISVQRLEQ